MSTKKTKRPTTRKHPKKHAKHGKKLAGPFMMDKIPTLI